MRHTHGGFAPPLQQPSRHTSERFAASLRHKRRGPAPHDSNPLHHISTRDAPHSSGLAPHFGTGCGFVAPRQPGCCAAQFNALRHTLRGVASHICIFFATLRPSLLLPFFLTSKQFSSFRHSMRRSRKLFAPPLCGRCAAQKGLSRRTFEPLCATLPKPCATLQKRLRRTFERFAARSRHKPQALAPHM